MSYLVLARKYRPQTFEQVVKQEHVTQTLANAILSDRVAHAILFSGPRGTGKTTVARILAKAMNCKEGPTPLPCNKCRSCEEITSGSAADVFEIDGASNNGVDQIRELRENVKYMPAHSPYKIYIIDEVHMLSIAAFNALLKTLEEPPSHIMFLFATTEPHKIPITILSRCQRHDLRRIDLESVAKHMKSLCDREGIGVDEKSLELIARESGGSMRDGLSLLDQVMTCTEGAITHEQILDILGIIDRKVLFDISAGILRGDVPEILDIFDNVYNHGHNIKELYSDLMEHFRNLLVVRMGKRVDKLVDVPAHEIALMTEQVRNVSETYLSQLLDILFKEESSIYLSSQPKLALEMAFVRMFQTKPVLPIDLLIEKLDNLKKGIHESLADDEQAPLSDRPQTGAQPAYDHPQAGEWEGRKPAPAYERPQAGEWKPAPASQAGEWEGRKQAPASQAGEWEGRKQAPASQAREWEGRKQAPASQAGEWEGRKQAPASQAGEWEGRKPAPASQAGEWEGRKQTPASQAGEWEGRKQTPAYERPQGGEWEGRKQTPAYERPQGGDSEQRKPAYDHPQAGIPERETVRTPERKDAGIPGREIAGPGEQGSSYSQGEVGNWEHEEPVREALNAHPDAEPQPPSVAVLFDPDKGPEKNWEKFVDIVSEKSLALSTCLEKCILKDMTDHRLEIEVTDNGFFRQRIDKNKAVIKSICNDFCGKEVELVVVNVEKSQENDGLTKKNKIDLARQDVLNHKMVKAALEIFGGRITEVKIL
ncbi:DNA polymerase III subunit gamma/tau [Desulfobacterales bacterium HSG2]|nr:DNA polymerase III subunit gamma/tau [Desulfobacterales bacterium HSG2]